MATSPVRDEYVSLRGLTFHYRDWRPPAGGAGGPPPPTGSGQAVVLLHGLASSCRIWDLAAPLLAERSRVVALDQRGHGLSDKPDDGYAFQDVCGDLGAFIEALGLQRPLLVGHSWGGSVALQFAADRPEAVRGIALVDGGFTQLSERMTWEEAEKQMTPPQIDGVPLATFLDFARNWPQLKDVWSPQVQEMVLSNFEVRDGRVYRRLPVEKHMKLVRALYDQQVSEAYTRIRCPALLIPAFREPESEPERRWMAARRRGIELAMARLANAKLLPMEDTVHDVPVQRPRELARAVAEFAEGLA